MVFGWVFVSNIKSSISSQDMEGDEGGRNGIPPKPIVLNDAYFIENQQGNEDSSPEILTQTQPFDSASIRERFRSLQERISSASHSQWKRFLAGLFGFPIAVGVLCFLLYMAFWADYDSRGTKNAGEVQFDGRTYEVYEFQMPSRFQNEFPADNWRLKIRHDVSDEDYRLYSEDDDGYRDFAIIDDDDDSAWMKFDTRRDYDMRYVYLQVEEEVIRLAISPSGNEPTKVSYSYDVENIFFAFQWTVFVVWPICAFAAIKWGFATNRPEFAYGVMISGGIATLLILVPLQDMLDDGVPLF